MKKYLLASLIFYLFISSCINKTERFDKDAAVEFSLNYLLSNRNKFHLPIDYINQPLQIIQTEHYKPNRQIYVNGYNCIMLPKSDKTEMLMKNMDIFKPLPIIEIVNIKSQDSIIYIDIILRATGHNFLIQLKDNNTSSHYNVIKIESRAI